MAVPHSVLQISPASWRRTKIFECHAATVYATVLHGLDNVAEPIINTKALADDNITVAVRAQGASTVIPPTVEFSVDGASIIVEMPAASTGYITLRRPHTSTR